MRILPILTLLIGLSAIGLLSCIFIVDEGQQALVLEFGKVKRVETSPGLKFKYPPPINTVVRFDKRILPLETTDLEVTPLDNRRLIVNAFARFRIRDPEVFQAAVQTEINGKSKLGQILNARVREVLGGVDSDAILSDQRAELMRLIRQQAQNQAAALGVEIVDVRIRRADLPEQNLKATYDRMVAERQQEAADQRARGEEAKRRKIAEGQRLATETRSEARKRSEIIKGEADAARNKIFANAFNQDPEFFAFYRSLNAYEQALQGENSTMVLSPDSEFFEYLKSDNARIER